jgi:hypothetical protein
MKKCNFTDVSKILSYEELRQKYEEAMYIISDQKMEIQELHQELNDYYQAFDELQNELSEYR